MSISKRGENRSVRRTTAFPPFLCLSMGRSDVKFWNLNTPLNPSPRALVLESVSFRPSHVEHEQ